MEWYKHREILRIVLLYALLGSAWIYLSDTVLSWLIQNPKVITQIAIFKGLFFILFTSIVLYLLINRLYTKLQSYNDALSRSENHLVTLIKTIPDLVWLKDQDGKYLSCNLQFENFFGANQENIVGKTDYDFVEQKLADFFRERDSIAIEARKPVVNEEWVTFASDGRRVILETIKTPMYDQNGELIGVLGIGRDITERKRIIDELQESEDKFRLTFDASPDAININRLEDGLYVDINSAFTQLIGFTRDEVIGKTSLELKIWADPGDREKLLNGLKEDGCFENLEAQFRAKDGTIITGLMSARAVKIKGVPHIVSVTRDISERILYEDELLKIEKLESLGILAGGIAHDFNNVLTGIIGNITLAKVYLEDQHKALAPLVKAEKAALRAGELAHQLLTFARGGDPVKKVVSPREIIEETLSLVLLGSNVKGTTDIADDIDDILNENQIEEIINELITQNYEH